MKRYFYAVTLVLVCAFSHTSVGKETATAAKITYFTLKPEIVTNYISKGNKLGFLSVSIDLMLANSADLAIVEYHQPLIRDTIITALSRESEQRIKSLAGRELIRQDCMNKVNKVLISEVDIDENIVTELLFTKYLYQ